MALSTRNVSVSIHDQTNQAVANATITVLLTKGDIDATEGYVAPVTQTFTTDASGDATLALWPNALGSEGSQYHITAADSDGERLFAVFATVPDADVNLWSIASPTPSTTPPYPPPDYEREARIVADVAELLKEPSPATSMETRIKRWIALVLQDANTRRRWWFLERAVTTEIAAGADIIDLRGDIGRMGTVFAPKQLERHTLSEIAELRAVAVDESRANAGPPSWYALEGARRVHLWPAPHKLTALSLVYSRPLRLPLVPEEWESVVLNGVIGRFGRHFDRDALSEDQAAYERRYEEGLRNTTSGTHDPVQMASWRNGGAGSATQQVGSTSGAAIDRLVPASLSGIGYVTIDTGDYPLEVT